MALTTAGAQLIPKALCDLNSPTRFLLANFYLGVGDNNTAFAIGQTDLQAATNKSRKLVSSLTEAAGVLTATSSWGTGEGNYEWIEWGSFNGNAGQTMLNRKVESPSLGTKTSAQVWTMVATLTFTAS